MDIINQQYMSNNPKSVYPNNNTLKETAGNTPQSVVNTSSDGTVTVSLRNTTAGDIFHGEITDISGKNVTVSLGNSQIINAMLGEKVPLSIGNQLYFEVKENSGDKVVIHPLTDDRYSALSQTAAKALDADGLNITDKNINLVKSMIDYNLPVDRASVLSMIKNTLQYPNADLHTMLSLKTAGIPINQQTIDGFTSYEQGTYQLNDKVSSLVSDVTSIFENPNGALNKEQLLSFNNTLLNLTMPKGESLPQISLTNAFSNIEEQLLSTPSVTIISNEESDAVPQTAIKGEEQGNPLAATQAAGKEMDASLIKAALSNEALPSESVAKTQPEPQSFLQNLTAGLEELGIPKEEIAKTIEQSKTLQDFMKNIHQLISKDGLASKEEITKFLGSKEYTSLVKEFLHSQWTLTPAQVKEKGQLDQVFERITSQSEQLSQSMKNMDMGSGNFSEHSQNAKDSIDYMQQMNDMYTYAQIPVKFPGGTTNSELFVYTNKKNLEKNSKDISVLLHLDMEHLGPTDVKVNLKGESINTRFYLNDNTSMEIISEHIEALNKRIKELGFDCQTEIIDRSKGKEELVSDFNKDFLLKDKPVGAKNKRVKFDVKA